jgi:hypothetical protein
MNDMKDMNDNLQKESEKATLMLKDKIIKCIKREKKEVLVEFTDGTRFFIDVVDDHLELSIT